MVFTLALSALLMGLAGSWHCAAMCGAASSAAQRGCAGGSGMAGAWWGFQVGRCAGYAAAGAVVASSVALLAHLGRLSPALQPLWTLAQGGALVLGVWLLYSGRQPAWLTNLGRSGAPAGAVVSVAVPVRAGGWQAMRGPAKAAAAGSFWFAWPCGLLHSALLLAALANGPAGGALVMSAFAIGSSVGLGALPLWLAQAGRRGAVMGMDRSAMLTRAAGAALAAGSLWALGQGTWSKVVAFCLS